MGFVFDGLSSKVLAAVVRVRKALGPGFLESVYEQALKIELADRGIQFESQKQIQVVYNGQVVGNHVLDVLVEGVLVLEIKAVSSLEAVHLAQLRSYLRATAAPVGLLVNFNGPRLQVKRLVNDYSQDNGLIPKRGVRDTANIHTEK